MSHAIVAWRMRWFGVTAPPIVPATQPPDEER